ncbi:methylmalonyl-CoA mutase [Sesbania bispinosa]|nr:methylmalonyl-CoA mutase [Sesbania bispinosa]
MVVEEEGIFSSGMAMVLMVDGLNAWFPSEWGGRGFIGGGGSAFSMALLFF